MSDLLKRWPEPGVHPKIAVPDIPVGASVLGMAPIGVRWMATMTRKGPKPDRGCPRHEFVPCFTQVDNEIREIA